MQFMSSIENYEKLLKIDAIQITAFKLGKKYEIKPSMTISGFISVPEDKPKPQISQNRFPFPVSSSPLSPNVGASSGLCFLAGNRPFAFQRETGYLLFNGKRGTENEERA